MIREAVGFLAGSRRAPEREDALTAALRLSRSGDPDRARAWTRLTIDLATSAEVPGTGDFLRETASAHTQTGWLARAALAARGEVDEAWLLERFHESPSGEAARALVRARAALPSVEAHEAAWSLITAVGTANDHLSAAFEGLAISGLADPGREDRALAILEEFWSTRTIGLGIRFVTGAFLGQVDVDDPSTGAYRVESLTTWLDAHPDAPAPLRRLLIETLDSSERRLRVQSLWGRP